LQAVAAPVCAQLMCIPPENQSYVFCQPFLPSLDDPSPAITVIVPTAKNKTNVNIAIFLNISPSFLNVRKSISSIYGKEKSGKEII
jgi:hypothetical protein